MNVPDRSFILRYKTLDLSQRRQSSDLRKRPPRPAALSTAGTVFRDPFFEQLFSKMKLYKTPCPEDVPGATNTVDNGVGNRLGSPLRGRTALRQCGSNLVLQHCRARK